MAHYLKVELLRMIRNRRYIIFVVAFPVGFYLLYSSLYGDQVDKATGVKGAVLLMVSMGAYGALASSMMATAVPWSQERHSGWLRQLQITPLRGWMIILTKIISALLLVLPSLILVSLAAVLLRHVSLPPGEWAALIGVMWLGTVPFIALGLTIGSLLPPDTAQPVAIVGMFGLALLGGLWFPVDLMPETMRTIAHAVPSYDYASIGWQIVAGQAPEASATIGIVAWSVVLAAIAVFAYRRATARA